jgi:hypothetical protein
VIRINHVTLPPGLSAFARRDSAGDLEVFVSRALPPDRQRAAVRVALRASRRAGWRGALLPVPVAGMLAGGRRWLRLVSRFVRAHLVATAAAAACALAVTEIVIAVLPQQPGHVGGGQLPAPAAVAPPPGQSTHSAGRPPAHARGHAAQPHPTPGTAGAVGSPAPGGGTSAPGQNTAPAPGQSTTPASGHSTTPAPGSSSQPTPSPVTSQPSSSPKPAPSHSGNTCVKVLGLTICL